jgi:pilus assembly protein CpaF
MSIGATLTPRVEPALVNRVRQRLTQARETPTIASVVSALRSEQSRPVGDTALLEMAEHVHADLVGAGPLSPLLADPDVTDVVVNGAREVWVDRGHGMERVEVSLGGERDLRRLAQRLAAACGRRLDTAQPFVDARLASGTRLHAVIPPVAKNGVCLSLRTFRPRAFTLDELTACATLTAESAELLRAVVHSRVAMLVTGGTGSGKTTLLAALLSEVPAAERILIVEDAAELQPDHPHVVTLEARVANADGAGEITLRDLLRQALRMRPDRIVVGECRGGEVVELLAALNTGHDGGAGTLHANRPEDVPARLEALAALGGLTGAALQAQIAAAFRVIVHVQRSPTGRLVDEISVLSPLRHAGGSRMEVLPAWRPDGGNLPGRPLLEELISPVRGRHRASAPNLTEQVRRGDGTESLASPESGIPSATPHPRPRSPRPWLGVAGDA